MGRKNKVLQGSEVITGSSGGPAATPPVSEIIAEFEKTEAEIRATFAELKEML